MKFWLFYFRVYIFWLAYRKDLTLVLKVLENNLSIFFLNI